MMSHVQAACDRAVQVTDRVPPGADASAYEAYYPIYRGLYPALKTTFADTANVVAQQPT